MAKIIVKTILIKDFDLEVIGDRINKFLCSYQEIKGQYEYIHEGRSIILTVCMPMKIANYATIVTLRSCLEEATVSLLTSITL